MCMNTKWKLAALPCVLGFLIFYILPFGRSIYYSFIKNAFDSSFVGLANYRAVLGNSYYRLALRNTFEFTLVSSCLLMVLSLAISLALNGGGRVMPKLRFAFILPMLLPTAAIIPIFERLFPINMLYQMGGNAFRIPVYLIYLWKNAGYNVILLTSALSMIPKEVNEAAALDGARGLFRLFRITLPMILPTLFFTAIMSVVQSLRVFKEVYLLYGSYPDPSVYLVQHYMNNHFNKLNYQNLTSGAIMFALMVGGIVSSYYWIERRRGI